MAAQLESKHPLTGWGEPFALLLCEDILVKNHAQNGQSTRSFIDKGLWAELLSQLKPGDVVLIQFGHNDQKISNPSLYASAWLDYAANLKRFVMDVRALDAMPVLLTSVVRRAYDSQGKLQPTHGDYPAVTRTLARQMQVPLIDLHAGTTKLVADAGPVSSRNLYLHLLPDEHKNYPQGIQDNTHLSADGALQVASLVAIDLKKIIPELRCL